MKKLKKNQSYFLKIFLSLVLCFFLSNKVFSNDIEIEIKGNKFTDENAILSLLEKLPTDLTDEYSNYIIKTLDDSLLFENVTVKILENKYIITISEYPNINNI